jgi:NTP pyrophosphatase (non-canonical NTP hydrolase)
MDRINRDGKISKIDFTQRLDFLSDEELMEYIKSKGSRYTLLKLVEELAELQKEILKDVNCKEKDKDAILEEIGDVVLHIECAMRIYNIVPAQIHNRIAYKFIKRRQKEAQK